MRSKATSYIAVRGSNLLITVDNVAQQRGDDDVVFFGRKRIPPTGVSRASERNLDLGIHHG